MAIELPLPPEQVFYADKSFNPQIKPIKPIIDYVHYPTLGCPALLGPEQPLQVLLSLPANANATGVRFRLTDRHRQQGATFELQHLGNPEELAGGPGGERKLFRYWLQVDDVPFALFDLLVTLDGVELEVQYNAMRRYPMITGNEKVIFCGDSQYNGDNHICLKRFIECVNLLDDVAWIAIIGDICDNGVKGSMNLIKLAATAHSGPVTQYYNSEYQQAHELLRTLRHPVLVVPGNHDGMSANAAYDDGNPSGIFTGPDPLNAVEYDGLHHFRRTFGPLYFRLDWGGTRYLFANSFELTRQQRLGYHAIVANWGGWMRDEQLKWLKRELVSAPDLRKVMVIHHDPRGGSMGARLGYYYRMRPYAFDRRWPILKAYLSYILKHGRTTFQQEWMAPEQGDVAGHPVQYLLRTMLEQKVWAVIMGHDNENWVDSYFAGHDLFRTEPSTIHYATRGDVGDDALVDNILDYLDKTEPNYEALLRLLEAEETKKGQAALSAALAEIERAASPAEVVFAPNPAQQWGIEVKSAIHFIHVDDVGAYKYSDESDFEDYGFVLATLEGGAPVKVQSCRISGKVGQVQKLEVD